MRTVLRGWTRALCAFGVATLLYLIVCGYLNPELRKAVIYAGLGMC